VSGQLQVPTALTPGKSALDSPWIGGCVGPSTGLGDMAKWKNILTRQELEVWAPCVQPIACSYTDRTVPAYSIHYNAQFMRRLMTAEVWSCVRILIPCPAIKYMKPLHIHMGAKWTLSLPLLPAIENCKIRTGENLLWCQKIILLSRVRFWQSHYMQQMLSY
jgi:hypothetical protein